MKEQQNELNAESYRPPNWLGDALQAYNDQSDTVMPVSAAFQVRYQEAATAALTLAQLRNERQRVGFVPLPWSSYIEGLAKVTGRSLRPVLAVLGIDNLADPVPSNVKAYARLGQSIGLTLREMLILVRIQIANQFNFAPIPLLLARQRSVRSHMDQLAECEAALQHLEMDYNVQVIEELEHIEAAIRAAYAASDAANR